MSAGAIVAGAGVLPGMAALEEATRGGERRLGVVLVGLGLYCRGQLGPALRRTKLCRLAGVVTGSREKGRAWGREYGFPESNVWNYDEMAHIAGRPDVDIIYVVTPNGLHAEHVIKAAAAGKHVICEKPMANTVAECDAMTAACAKAGVRMSIGYRLQFDPHHIELDRVARERTYGQLTRLSGEHSWTFQHRAWRIERALSGGGPLMDVGIYVIQAACRAGLGLPVALTARELPKTNPELFNEVEETIEWTMEYAGGVTCQASSSYARNHAFFRAEGDRGWIHIEPAYGYDGLEVQTSDRGHLAIPQVPQQALQMDDFARCLMTGAETSVPAAMGRAHMVIIEGIYRSASEGGRRLVLNYA
jgi:glucose-fructose oxidoreductase